MKEIGYQKKYTGEAVVDYLTKSHPLERSYPEIRGHLKGSSSTVENLLRELLTAGKIKRRNVGNENKPIWMYSLSKLPAAKAA